MLIALSHLVGSPVTATPSILLVLPGHAWLVAITLEKVRDSGTLSSLPTDLLDSAVPLHAFLRQKQRSMVPFSGKVKTLFKTEGVTSIY